MLRENTCFWNLIYSQFSILKEFILCKASDLKVIDTCNWFVPVKVGWKCNASDNSEGSPARVSSWFYDVRPSIISMPVCLSLTQFCCKCSFAYARAFMYIPVYSCVLVHRIFNKFIPDKLTFVNEKNIAFLDFYVLRLSILSYCMDKHEYSNALDFNSTMQVCVDVKIKPFVYQIHFLCRIFKGKTFIFHCIPTLSIINDKRIMSCVFRTFCDVVFLRVEYLKHALSTIKWISTCLTLVASAQSVIVGCSVSMISPVLSSSPPARPGTWFCGKIRQKTDWSNPWNYLS